MIRASGTRSPPAAPDGRRTAYTRIVAPLGYRLISLVTAIIVAACPTLFAVCEERCGHNARRAAGPTHLHQAAGESEKNDVTATTRVAGQTMSVAAAQEHESSCHRALAAATSLAPEATGAAASTNASHADAALSAAIESAASHAAHMTPTCSQCFSDAPVLVAARSADNRSGSRPRGVDAVALLPPARAFAAAFELRTNAHISRIAPPSPPSAPLVLRL